MVRPNGMPRGRLAALALVVGIFSAVVTYVALDYFAPPAAQQPANIQKPEVIRPSLSSISVTIIDGDTIRVLGRSTRLVGFDTAETGNRARCQRERELAARATARLRQLVSEGGLDLRIVRCACLPGTDGTRACNYGRACGELRAHGRDVGTILISEGLARPFHCGAYSCPSRPSWCD